MSADATPWDLTARWVFPADRPPIADGVVSIQHDKIVAVESAGTRKTEVDLGNAAILPGLVNAHTHLDLSDARGKISPTSDFTAWLTQVIAHRQQQTTEQSNLAIAFGIAESARHGITLVGDITATGASHVLLRRAPMRSVAYFEVLGLSRNRIVASIESARQWLDDCTQSNVSDLLAGLPGSSGLGHESPVEHRQSMVMPGLSPYAPYELLAWRPGDPEPEYASLVENRRSMVIPGLSPHAPYSVNTWAFWLTSTWSRNSGIPVAVHLAETQSEFELLSSRSGAFVPFLERIGAWTPDAFVPSVDWIVHLFEHGPSVLWIHGNYLPIDLPYSHHTIVYCPRTHAAFGHPPHPFREFMKRGVRVVLGTDSLASNPDLDILAEARFVAARHPDLPGQTLLRMITLDGAIALGWGDVTGSLTPGKSADLAVLPLPDREEKDPYRLVFESEMPVRRVLFRGQWQ